MMSTKIDNKRSVIKIYQAEGKGRIDRAQREDRRRLTYNLPTLCRHQCDCTKAVQCQYKHLPLHY